MMSANSSFTALNIAVLTVSDSRSIDTDSSGQLLVDELSKAGHQLAYRGIVIDDIYQIRAKVSAWIADLEVDVILLTGGTGFSGRDSTPEALLPLFDKTVEGFGELFRYLSLKDIGTSTIQSRALAGFANNTVIFAMPGSTGACRLAWNSILVEQLNAMHKPCNFVGVLNSRRT